MHQVAYIFSFSKVESKCHPSQRLKSIFTLQGIKVYMEASQMLSTFGQLFVCFFSDSKHNALLYIEYIHLVG